MEPEKVLLTEENVISLRTAIVLDDGNFVGFRLMPASLESSIPGKRKAHEWVFSDFAYLYRHLRSPAEETELRSRSVPTAEFWVKPLSFVDPPALRLVWADSGNTVALYLNGEPWAFIYEETHTGYSKGIHEQTHTGFAKLRCPLAASAWDQDLFEKAFA